MGFLRQKYWSGLTFPPPGDIPNPGIQTHVSCITGRFFTIWATREAHSVLYISLTFIFCGSKITADGDCSHEIKTHLLLGRKDKTNLDSILKSRDITWPKKVHLVKAIFFPVVMYGCESLKKAECRKIDAFELWCWRRLFRAPWTARRSNQSLQEEFRPECSLEGLTLQLKLQYFSQLRGRTGSLERTLILGKIEGGSRWMTQDEMVERHHWLNGHEFV